MLLKVIALCIVGTKKGHFDESTRPYLHIFQKLANLCRVVDPGLVHVQEYLLFLKISMSYLGWIKGNISYEKEQSDLFPIPYSIFHVHLLN